ncbi:hypothetical protein [Ruegeria lacuscaerulensis]|uniref:hypothetical protein n=1 Tax=Ruegeria lacuscaerulensis TaxID=55218 RepID=UPI00147B4170|nr:hypothetical protein [Ruegeria lacuscaerulensis]
MNSKVDACENTLDTDMEAKRCGDALATLDKAISIYANDDHVDILWRDRAWVKTMLGDF